jgi:hypothetical protein
MAAVSGKKTHQRQPSIPGHGLDGRLLLERWLGDPDQTADPRDVVRHDPNGIPGSTCEWGSAGLVVLCGLDDVEDHVDDEFRVCFLHGVACVDDGLLGLRAENQPASLILDVGSHP